MASRSAVDQPRKFCLVGRGWRALRGGLLCAAVLGPLALVAGCGGRGEELPRAAVSGSVTLDGKPLAEGVIQFIPTGETSGPQTTVPIQNGTFRADAHAGPVVGRHRIEIESTDTGGYARDDEQALERLQQQRRKHVEVVDVPARYNQHSRITKEVTADGPNEFDFDLQTPDVPGRIAHRR